ncbi:MAG: polysaccharide deacetylase family protein [Rubrivivax sp.]|nr:polysaccharide deacetylase family protein [Rubrivivax sp.]
MLKPLKALTKAVVSPMLDATGIYGRRIEQVSAEPGAWAIVMYHRVIDDPAQDPFQLGMCVMRDRFERQIRYLRSTFNILTVSEAMRRLDLGEPLPERALSVTFDDGYLDNLTRALPVMQRYDVPFSVYVPTGGLEEGTMLWWDRVVALLAGTRRFELDLRDVGLALQSEPLSLRGVTAAANAERVLDLLWSLDRPECERCIALLEQVLGPVDGRATRAERLSPEQVRELRRQGVEIGAHSVTHPNLALADEATARSEMLQSRRTLESLLQEPVSGFAYPGGRLQTTAQRLSRELGFSYALATLPGTNRPDYERSRLRRIGMPDAELPDFRRAFSGALERGIADAHLRF